MKQVPPVSTKKYQKNKIIVENGEHHLYSFSSLFYPSCLSVLMAECHVFLCQHNTLYKLYLLEKQQKYIKFQDTS